MNIPEEQDLNVSKAEKSPDPDVLMLEDWLPTAMSDSEIRAELTARMLYGHLGNRLHIDRSLIDRIDSGSFSVDLAGDESFAARLLPKDPLAHFNELAARQEPSATVESKSWFKRLTRR